MSDRLTELIEESRKLCYGIESLPTSEQQTKISILASDVYHKLVAMKENKQLTLGETIILEGFYNER